MPIWRMAAVVIMYKCSLYGVNTVEKKKDHNSIQFILYKILYNIIITVYMCANNIMFTPARDFLLETPWRIIIPNLNVNSHSGWSW
jgi:hypothetical protein